MRFPIEVSNSRVPGWIGKLTGMRITGFSFGVWIFSSGIFSTRQRNHETIHFKQWRELLFVGFALLYPTFFVINFVRFKGDVLKAYRLNAFEREAFEHDVCPYWLDERPHFAWVRYIIRPF